MKSEQCTLGFRRCLDNSSSSESFPAPMETGNVEVVRIKLRLNNYKRICTTMSASTTIK